MTLFNLFHLKINQHTVYETVVHGVEVSFQISGQLEMIAPKEVEIWVQVCWVGHILCRMLFWAFLVYLEWMIASQIKIRPPHLVGEELIIIGMCTAVSVFLRGIQRAYQLWHLQFFFLYMIQRVTETSLYEGKDKLGEKKMRKEEKFLDSIFICFTSPTLCYECFLFPRSSALSFWVAFFAP